MPLAYAEQNSRASGTFANVLRSGVAGGPRCERLGFAVGIHSDCLAVGHQAFCGLLDRLQETNWAGAKGHIERIKQRLFCKSGFSEVGHLASMFR